MRRSDPPRRGVRAVQLPTSASGNRLCRHGIPGSCTTWCSYKLFAKAVAITIAVLALIIGGVWLTGGEGKDRTRDVLLGLGCYLVLVVPGIVFLNSRDRD